MQSRNKIILASLAFAALFTMDPATSFAEGSKRESAEVKAKAKAEEHKKHVAKVMADHGIPARVKTLETDIQRDTTVILAELKQPQVLSTIAAVIDKVTNDLKHTSQQQAIAFAGKITGDLTKALPQFLKSPGVQQVLSDLKLVINEDGTWFTHYLERTATEVVQILESSPAVMDALKGLVAQLETEPKLVQALEVDGIKILKSLD